MMNKQILTSIVCLFLTYGLFGQFAVETLRYSELLPSGTARMVGVGGAMSSLGGDMGAFNLNPAGIAVYRKSEFNVSPALQITGATSVLNSEFELKENKTTFGLENIGLVFHKGYNNNKLKAFNFGVTINRVANFNRTTRYEGSGPGSIVNSFQANSQGLTDGELDGFTGGIAADAGAIFILDGDQDTQWSSDFRDFIGDLWNFEGSSIERSETITTSGGLSELAFTMGLNISHKLYLGGSAFFPIARFEETRRYVEDDRNTNAVPLFRDLIYEQAVTTTGVGFGFKAGFIYRITNEIRLGGAVQSPTRLSLNDDFTTSLNYFYLNPVVDEYGVETGDEELIDGEGLSPIGESQYALTTPWRISGGVSVVLKKLGFISLDVEHFNYANQRYDFTVANNTVESRNAEETVNREIQSSFTNALNVKLGAEYLINKFRIRAGYGIFGSPFEDANNTRNILSFGAGIRGENAFLDLAFRNTRSSETLSPYTSPNAFQQLVSSDISTNNIIMTFGYRF